MLKRTGGAICIEPLDCISSAQPDFSPAQVAAPLLYSNTHARPRRGLVEGLGASEPPTPSKASSPPFVRPPPDALPFQQLEEALGHSIIMAIPTSTHAGNQIVLAEKRLPFLTGELRALVRMYHDLGLWFAPPNSTQ